MKNDHSNANTDWAQEHADAAGLDSSECRQSADQQPADQQPAENLSQLHESFAHPKPSAQETGTASVPASDQEAELASLFAQADFAEQDQFEYAHGFLSPLDSMDPEAASVRSDELSAVSHTNSHGSNSFEDSWLTEPFGSDGFDAGSSAKTGRLAEADGSLSDGSLSDGYGFDGGWEHGFANQISPSVLADASAAEDLPVMLNAMQQSAVETTEGCIRVIAGAGSGKTRTLAHRFAYLVNDLGIMPGSILCVTFTNKSAAEMRSRIHALTGDNDTGMVCTFHSFCNTVLLEESHAIHYPKSFMVVDNSDIDEFLKIIYEERGLTSRNMTFSKARDMIEIKKIKEIPDYYQDLISLSLEQLHAKYMNASQPDEIIFYGYLYQEKKNFALDYNDLILLTLHIFEQNEEIAQKWKEKLEYIMIDEFQDIDGLQYRLMEVLAGYHGNLFVVGDPDQTIYTWRGANPAYLLEFDQHFPDVTTIMLNENYRSTPQILQSANALIDHNALRMSKELFTQRPSGPMVQAMHFPSAARQAKAAAALIGHLLEKGYQRRNIAILYRAHYMSRALEDEFLLQKIPYTLYSGVQFFQRMEIKDAIAYLRMLVFRSDLDFIRTINTPKRNFGKTRMDFLKEEAARTSKSLYETLLANMDHPLIRKSQAAAYVELIEQTAWQNRPATEVLSEVLDRSGYEAMLRLQGAQDRLDNLAELKQAASEYEISAGEDVDIEAWLQHISLFTNADREMKSDTVKMMTIHTAKGLEFPVVIMPDLNEGLFPTRKTRTRQALEEERRLAFVGMTRAKERLYLMDAQGQSATAGFRYPSRFLLEVADTVVWNPKPNDELLRQTRLLSQRQQEAPASHLQAGDGVRHKVFGEGAVMEVDVKNQSYLIHFDKLNTTRKLSFKAPLEKISENALNKVFS